MDDWEYEPNRNEETGSQADHGNGKKCNKRKQHNMSFLLHGNFECFIVLY